MFCVNCGKTVPSDAQFCINCGTSLPDAALQTAPLAATESGTSFSAEPTPSSDAGWSSEPLASSGSSSQPEPGFSNWASGPAAPVGSAPAVVQQTTISSSASPLPSGNDPAMLDRLPQWNWGAFLLAPIWCFFHRLYLLAVVAFFVGFPIVNIVVALVGNKEAWKTRTFASLEEFNAVQRKWAIGGLITWAVMFVMFGGFVMLLIVAGAMSESR